MWQLIVREKHRNKQIESGGKSIGATVNVVLINISLSTIAVRTNAVVYYREEMLIFRD